MNLKKNLVLKTLTLKRFIDDLFQETNVFQRRFMITLTQCNDAVSNNMLIETRDSSS